MNNGQQQTTWKQKESYLLKTEMEISILAISSYTTHCIKNLSIWTDFSSKINLSLTNVFFSRVITFEIFLGRYFNELKYKTKQKETLKIFGSISEFCNLWINTGTYVLASKFP